MRKRNRSRPSYHVKYDVKERAIYLRGEIKARTSFLLDRAVKTIRQDCSCVQKPIFFFIDSPGGDFDATMAIWNTFTPFSDQLITIARHQAYSSGILLLQLGKLRLAISTTKFLVHSAWVEIPGKNPRFNSAEGLGIFNASNIMNYSQLAILTRHGSLASQILPMLSRQEDTFFGVKEAKQLKLLDGVIKTNKLSQIKSKTLKKFRAIKDI